MSSVQTLSSSQSVSAVHGTQAPVSGSQVCPSGQTTGSYLHEPSIGWHVPIVHRSPSTHSTPQHRSVLPQHGSGSAQHGSELPQHGSEFPQHGSELPQHGITVPVHSPLEQVSPEVQLFPSSQIVLSGSGNHIEALVRGWHDWQELPGFTAPSA